MIAIHAWTIIALVLAASSTNPTAASNLPLDTQLREAFRTSDVAEIYLIRRGISFPGAPRPDTVRSLGCKYLLFPGSSQWQELERALAGADIRAVSTGPAVEVRVGLVLSDRLGTLWDVYADYPYAGETVVPGLSQRRRVTVSASFVTALEGFARRHPDFIDGSRAQLCDDAPAR